MAVQTDSSSSWHSQCRLSQTGHAHAWETSVPSCSRAVPVGTSAQASCTAVAGPSCEAQGPLGLEADLEGWEAREALVRCCCCCAEAAAPPPLALPLAPVPMSPAPFALDVFPPRLRARGSDVVHYLLQSIPDSGF